MEFFLFLFSVPAPEVEVTTSSNGTLYQATQQSLFCTVRFPNLLPPNGIIVYFQWDFQGTVVGNSTRVTVSKLYFTLDPNSTLTSSSITFSPVNTTDSGNYECFVGFSLVGSPVNILAPGDQQKSINVIVEGTCRPFNFCFPPCMSDLFACIGMLICNAYKYM